MSSFRTSSVFRFTKDYELLKKIIRDGIIPNYCEEDLSYGTFEFFVGIPMASFCDIPITLLDEHTHRYGNYGIALSKEWAIENSISPLMYIANDAALRSVQFHYRRNQDFINGFTQQIKECKEKGIDPIMGISRDDHVQAQNSDQVHIANTHIIGYIKKYMGEYRSKPINNYEENEWRFLVPDIKGSEWFWSKKDYIKWRFPNNDWDAPKPSPSAEMKRWTLRFSSSDVSYILLKDDEFKLKVIEYIKKLKTIGGNTITSEEQRDDMISKLITLDQVKKDF